MTLQTLPKDDKRVLSLIKTGAENAITGATLTSWVKKGLKVYQPPFESSKKQYFRVSDVINFLTVR